MLLLRFSFPVIITLLCFAPSIYAEDLNKDYLAGEWCHSYTQFGADRQDEMINFLFEKNGTFSYQTSKHNEALKSGFKYELLSGEIKLKSVYPGVLKIASIKDNEMVLNYFGDLHFVRGACP